MVRAVDSSNAFEDPNTVEHGAPVTGPISNALADTFEGGGGFDTAGWTHSPIAGATDWALSTAQAQTPIHSWFSADVAGPPASDRVLVTPSFAATAGSTLSFWHTFAFETSSGNCYDAGTLEVSTNGGSVWTVLPDQAFISGGFTGTVNSNFSNPLAGKRAWCMGSIGPMTEVTADLSALAGPDVKLRWHEGDDTSVSATGWYVDSVTISSAAACTPGAIFSDGFESGEMPGSWSGVTP